MRILKNVHVSLLDWFKQYGRHGLAWRKTDDIYAIFLSEVMLQQTQASRVAEYYYPHFLQKYPTLKHFARASLDEILSDWSGLGYYSRARNLHKALNLCKKTGLPQTMEALQKLPGVGRYTASAVCSFALNQKVAVIDTNIKRVLKRYFAQMNDKEILKEAEIFLNQDTPKEHNLALMDLGSLLCTSKNPRCPKCPLMLTCKGINEPEIYTSKQKIQYEKLDIFLGICLVNKKLALVKSSEKLYKGLFVLPEVEPLEENFIASFKHSYTKYRLSVFLYTTDYAPQNASYFTYEELLQAPISSMIKKAVSFLDF
ncbi:MAG: A/G-specific adenine glycosylase [Sulfurospirillum sp.]|nr:A/G-specific adenine glycosylase [Sulfurospirillum sp.]